MASLIKKGLMLGLGITSMTKEAIEKTVKELEKKGEINAKEGKKMVGDLLKKSKKQNEEIKKTIEEQVQKALKSLPIATKKDIDALSAKIDKISRKAKKNKK
ncbi:MAG: phasin family protein [Nanoarchaeota archaeon]|nr:phasin family protein [Nanoarchaeota archaeon]MCK5629613.1 phasin family protein [Nanoarchaeota archaeon]